jgi:simple sugar transport system permease protein
VSAAAEDTAPSAMSTVKMTDDPADAVAAADKGADAAVQPGDQLEVAGRSSWRTLLTRPEPQGIAIGIGGLLASLAIFSVIVAILGASPFKIYSTMLHSAVLDNGTFAQTILRSIPIALAALAVAVPARAGLVNVGGEGQLILGAVAATGVGLAVGSRIPGPFSWLCMALAGAAAGAIWGGLAGVLRAKLSANESVTTLLLNFVANDIMLYLIYQPWRDPHGTGQTQSRPLAERAVLPKIFGSQLNLGIIITAVVALGLWLLLSRSGWGFALRVVGGNQVAAARAGLPVQRLFVTSMLVGGSLAGLGGALNFAGVETQLRPGITASFGYIAFLASYLARHRPLRVVGVSIIFSAVALTGNGLQLQENLDGNVVDVLLALIVLGPLVTGAIKLRRAS